jgi:putative N6-adenine-specific DNA methylase
MGKNFKIVVKTLFGFEELLAEELTKIGALHVKSGQRMVSCEGDNGFLYKANLACRTAIKILKPIHTCKVKDEQSLYDAIYAIDWSAYLNEQQTLAIDATVFSTRFTHSKYVALKCKDAIVDQFRNKTGIRPSIDTESPDLRLNIHIHEDECTVSLDSSGLSLHVRGYKTAGHIAPISEVLAAGLLMMSGWEGQCDFYDPMCGGGTILIEAAMIACNIPPNIHRREFAFERWPDFDKALFEKIKESLLQKTRDMPFAIYGTDIDFKNVKQSRENIHNAHLEEFIEVRQGDFFQSNKKTEGPLHILFNPPYDERISIETEDFHLQIGNTLKRNYPGTKAWMVSANAEALKYVGLKPSKKIKVYNGSLEARLLLYDIYAGSKRYGSNPLTPEA